MIVLLPFALVTLAAAWDLRTREIPDWISLALLAWACLAASMGLYGLTWPKLGLGLGMGLALSAPLFYVGGLGGGDVKLISSLGAALGPAALLWTLLWMALAGGCLALVAVARGRRDFAYGPAIAIGMAAYLIYPGGILRVISN